ncbi:MAG: ankyrin repeat domain-containing protein [Deltaproteobacteria bacterium]|nr:ankyrin repeat domain-containing protein [Deltaproteobacteria bacterium]
MPSAHLHLLPTGLALLLLLGAVPTCLGGCRPTPRVERGKPKIVRQIRSAGMEYTARELREQARAGELENVRLFLEAGMDPDIRRHWRASRALHETCREGHARVAALLLRHGANIDARDPLASRTPLMSAAERGHREVVRVLLEHGADPALRDERGQTARDLARRHGHEEVVALLDSR